MIETHGDEEVRHHLARIRDRLAPWDRAMTDYLLALASEDRMVRLWAVQEVAELAPDSDWLFEPGTSAFHNNWLQEAVDALEGIDPTNGWMNEWTSYCLVVLHARRALGDCQGELGKVLDDLVRPDAESLGQLLQAGALLLGCI